MSSSLIRHRPRRLAVLGAVVALGLLVGCTGQRDPGGYGDSVRKNFVAGCDGSAFADFDPDSADAKEMKGQALPTPQCECIYDYMEENVDFDDFSKANSERRDDPSALDDPVFEEALDRATCGPDGAMEGKTDKKTETTESTEKTTTTEG
ncbi:MAG: hypothetical protein ABI239_11575 [Aquihabitans sp.]